MPSCRSGDLTGNQNEGVVLFAGDLMGDAINEANRVGLREGSRLP